MLVTVIFLLASARVAAADGLEDRLAKLARGHHGKVAIAVKNLLDKSEAVYLDADEAFPTASLIKFPVMLEVYMQVLEGKVRLEDKVTLKNADKVPGSGILTYHFSEGASFPLRDSVRLMIVYSDNTATNLVLDKIGIASTGQRMKAWGFPHTKIHSKVFKASTTIDPEGSKKYGLGSTTAREMVGLLEKLYRNDVATPEACKEMLGHLKKCEDGTKLKRLLPANIEVAHKTGTVNEVKTDAGILYLPACPVAVCVLTNQNADRSYKTDNEANILIGQIAKEVYDHYAGKEKKRARPGKASPAAGIRSSPAQAALERVRVAEDRKSFVLARSGKPFTP
jgi:beta-lactamase class A